MIERFLRAHYGIVSSFLFVACAMQFVPIQDIRLINEIPVLELIFTFLLVLYSNSTFVQMMDTHFNRIK